MVEKNKSAEKREASGGGGEKENRSRERWGAGNASLEGGERGWEKKFCRKKKLKMGLKRRFEWMQNVMK